MISNLPIFVTFAGYVIGLGAVTVIDMHGFLAQKSPYWTQATIQTHKITKPLIWLGMLISSFGSFLTYTLLGFSFGAYFQLLLYIPMVLNGIFLSFWLSPKLIEREKKGREQEILPNKWQNAIKVSFVFSAFTWWAGLYAFVLYLTTKIILQ